MEIAPEQASDLCIPPSNKTVRVRAIDTTTRMVCDAEAFVDPVIRGHEKLNFKTLAFLIEHDAPGGTERVLFDAGARKDFWNGSPQSQKMIGSFVPAVQVDYGIDEIIVNSGLPLSEIKAVIWSHWHWDHIGDGSKLPASTDIVVGPGFTDSFVPGWPIRPESPILDKDLAGHRIHEPQFPLTIGGFRAHDYFNDGSFYLLDVPGHAVGHICGFARTTPSSFVFLGADCCHYAGMIRPSAYTPLPPILPAEQLDAYYPQPCPCAVFTAHHPATDNQQARVNPFYQVSTAPGGAYTFGDVAQKTLTLLQQFDASPHVFLCLAHDGALFDLLPLYNSHPHRDINDWKEQKYDERSRWRFLNELPKNGDSPGREVLVPGLIRDGKIILWNEADGFHEPL